jgi:hypothetical protein
MSISTSTIKVVKRTSQLEHLNRLERSLLWIPALAGAFFGLVPMLLPAWFASISSLPGNDPYIYRIAGAATFGYFVALAFALRQSYWPQIRMLVISVLTFNLASLYACGVELTAGKATPMVDLITVASLFFVGLTATLLYRHRELPELKPDVARGVVWFLAIATLLAAVFGLLPLFFTDLFGSFFGFKATDGFIFRQAGASTLGYAVMGIFELRSRHWQELRWPILMALVFNAFSFFVSLFAIIAGEAVWLVYLIAAASFVISLAAILILWRRGK